MGSSKVIKSGIWYTLSNFLLNGISFLTTSIFARLLSKEEYGEFSNFVSWISIASIFITLNTSASVLTAQEDYRGKEKEYTFSLILASVLEPGIETMKSPFAMIHASDTCAGVHFFCSAIFLIRSNNS